ncbi:TolC family protein [Noviherbaspirillum saxi]|uniref:TolC family protein n=2 Tax=Noviherbaspirillum saxi TaxID=2320863 RepID=A0A3A3G3X9_9BURK|nr:TolC family protein [Noviherbaspirillum saxi]
MEPEIRSRRVGTTSSGLTLAEALRHATARSLQLVAQDRSASASLEMATAARQLPDPVLRGGIENLPVSGADRFSLTGDAMTMRRIGVSQEFTGSDKRRLRADRFTRESEKMLAEKDLAAAAIERDTALVWFDVYYAETMASVIASQREQAKAEIVAAESSYRGGTGSQADILAAKSGLAEVDNRASETARRIRSARTMLARWIGEAASRPLAERPSVDLVPVDVSTILRQLDEHPQIALLARQEKISTTEIQLAQANKSSDWSVELAYSQRGSMQGNMLSVGLSIPFQIDPKNRQDREISASIAKGAQAAAEREEALRAVTAEVRNTAAEWENGRERHLRFERELLPLAKQRTQASLAAYRGGKVMLADVLAARRNEIDVRLQALQLEADIARLWVQLRFYTAQSDPAPHAATGGPGNMQ